MSVSSLRVRRSAISSTLTLLGARNVTQNPSVACVIRGAALRAVKFRKRIPAWDLGLVLRYLLTLEPLDDLPLVKLTMKTAFLVMLASGRRASEVTNLSGLEADVAFEPDGSISLNFLPEFLAKNQVPGDVSPVILIKPLSSLISPSEKDIHNCPVRALKCYRRKTKAFRSDTQRALFLSVNMLYTSDIRPTTFSRWIRNTILEAYEGWDRERGGGYVLPLSHARAHELRAWAASLASKSVAMKDLLQAAYWRSEDVFISCYLRDIAASREDGSFALPALVAAQAAIPPSRRH